MLRRRWGCGCGGGKWGGRPRRKYPRRIFWPDELDKLFRQTGSPPPPPRMRARGRHQISPLSAGWVSGGVEGKRERERMRWWIESGGRKEEMRRNLARWREEEKRRGRRVHSAHLAAMLVGPPLPPHFPSLFLGWGGGL